MTQKFNLALEPCILCGSSDFEQTVLGTSLADASDFASKGEEQSLFRYELVMCTACNHSSVQTDNPCWLPTRKHDFIKYGEPTEHYSRIVEILKQLDLRSDDISIHTFSNKDFKLANFLANELNIADPELRDYAGCSGDWLPVSSNGNLIGAPQHLRRFQNEIEKSKKSKNVNPPTTENKFLQFDDPVISASICCGIAQTSNTDALNCEFNFPIFTIH